MILHYRRRSFFPKAPTPPTPRPRPAGPPPAAPPPPPPQSPGAGPRHGPPCGPQIKRRRGGEAARPRRGHTAGRRSDRAGPPGGEARRPHLPLLTSCPGPTAPGKIVPARGGWGALQGRTMAHSEAPHQARGPKPPSRPRTGTSHRRSSRKGTPPRPAQCTPA